MAAIKDLACWEIMNCGSIKGNCPAKQGTEQPCWEIVRELADHRVEFDICPDCIVYMVKNTNLSLSTQEINQVREKVNGSCIIAAQIA